MVRLVRSFATKAYDAIVREMQRRAQQRPIYTGGKLNLPDFGTHRVLRERYEPITRGDLVLINLEPCVVVKTPEAPSGSYIVANRVGCAKEVALPSIDSRLLSLLPENVFAEAKHSIYAPDDSVSAPLSVIQNPPREKDVAQDVSKPVVRVVNSWLYDIISSPLSELHSKVTDLSRKILSRVSDEIARLRHDIDPVVLPFSEFVDRTLKLPPGTMSVIEYYAVALCLDHQSLRCSRQLRLSYAGIDAVQLLPSSTEQRVRGALDNSDGNQEAFVFDYSRKNLPEGEPESRAIEILRKKYPEKSYIDSAVAADLLQDENRIRGNNWFQWVLHHQPNKYLVGEDKMCGMRSEYTHPVYCIDDAGAHEIDDGISLEELGNDKVRLGVHIANPTSFLDIPTALKTLLPVSSSVYLYDRALRLLPDEFSNLFSLTGSGEPRPALSMFVDLDLNSGELNSVIIKPLMLTNAESRDPAAIDKKKFARFDQAAQLLMQRRVRNGAITFMDYLEPTLDPYALAQTTPGKTIVTEFMIMANNLAADYSVRHGIPQLFRAQNVLLQSKTLKDAYAAEVVAKNGLMDASWASAMRRSRVVTKPSRHDGMGVDVTTRFTSPLRRVEDLVTHHQLEAHLLANKDIMLSQVQLSSICERLLLSESLIKELQRADANYVSLQALQPRTVALGVVQSAALETKVHLPAYDLDAIYVGSTPLQPFSVHQFKVAKSSPAGGYATVDVHN